VSVYSAQQWQEHFERPWVIPNDRYLRTSTEVEGGGGHIFCRVCVKPKKHGKLLAFKMHVTIDGIDPMQVAKYGIITLECHGCGFEQIVPRKPKIRGQSVDDVHVDEFANIDQSKLGQIMRQAPQFPNIGKGMSIGMQHEFLNHIQQLRAEGIIDEQRYAEFNKRYEHMARQQVDRAVNPPILNPKKWPAGP